MCGWQCSGTRVLPACKGRRRRRRQLCRAGRRLCWRRPRSRAERQECLLDPLAKAASLEPWGGRGEHCRSQCNLADRVPSNSLYPGSGASTILSLATCCSSRRWLLRQHKKLYFCGCAGLGTSRSGFPCSLLLYPSAGAQLPAPERLDCTSSRLAKCASKVSFAFAWRWSHGGCVMGFPAKSVSPLPPLLLAPRVFEAAGGLSNTVQHPRERVPGGLRERVGAACTSAGH